MGSPSLLPGYPSEVQAFVKASMQQTFRGDLFADLAPECASAYHHYGTAIFYKAQEAQDVFGAPLQQAAEEQEDDGEEQDNRVVAHRGERSQ